MTLISAVLEQAVTKALRKAQKKGDLPPFDLPETVTIERPKDESMGEYATPVCMQLARFARMAPVKIAEAVVKRMPDLDAVGSVEIAHPGFINFRLSASWLTAQVDGILSAPDSFGSVDLGHGSKIQVEYVSSNPTGPLHIGAARNAVLGDALAAVLDSAGYDVQREYYVNDAGSRREAFGETLFARYAQSLGQDEPVPEEGYHGSYMVDLGVRVSSEHGAKYLEMPRKQAILELGALGIAEMVRQAEVDLSAMGVTYDEWFSEQSLYDSGQFEHIMTLLREGDDLSPAGYLDIHDGAVWFMATKLGGPKDEVVIRSSGAPGYFASDIAYHYNKFVERGFDRVIDIWGADHQGHVPRMRAMMKALRLAPERLTLIIYQLVTLKRGGEIVRLSKRTGDIITLREVLDEVGADAIRYFLVCKSADSQMEFDLDLAVSQSDDNPVHYVRYAHARICSILRKAELLSLDASGGDVSLLVSEPELKLIRKMVTLPEVVWTSASQLAPHHLAYYAYELASEFHSFYRDCRVIETDPEGEQITLSRLKLVSACKAVLARTLGFLGVSAPEVM